MAQTSQEPPQEGDLPDPCDVHPPPICEDQVVANPNAVPAMHETEAIIDSGASDCMVPSFRHLDMTRMAFCLATIANGTLHESNYQGLLRVLMRCCRTGRQHIAPMLDTLPVPGLRKILWSVPALCSQGHEVLFGLSTVRIVFHVGTERQFEVCLNNAQHAREQGPLPFPTAHHVMKIENLEDIDSLSNEDNSSDDDIPDLAPRISSIASSEVSSQRDAESILLNDFPTLEAFDPLVTEPIDSPFFAGAPSQHNCECDIEDDSAASPEDVPPLLTPDEALDRC